MEVKALQTLRHSKHSVNLIEYFENDEGMFAVIDNAETKSLRDIIHLFPERGCSIIFVQTTFRKLVQKVQSMHSKCVVHRNINMDAVYVKESSKKLFKVTKLAKLDLAYYIKPNQAIRQ